jgi:GTP-binding protein SAR1
MFVFNWLKVALNTVGLFKKTTRIALFGLDNSGKTTLLYRLKYDQKIPLSPIKKPPQTEEFIIDNATFNIFDLEGFNEDRKIWREYYSRINGVVYVIDAADPSRFADSKIVLDALLATPELSKMPFVILANKIDKKDAVSEDELRVAFDLSPEIDDRPIELFMCSVVKKIGYEEGLSWLSKVI